MNHLIISGINVSDRADVGVERVGRFSEGLEQLPETARKLRQGRFSDGMERLPATRDDTLHRGRFSEGMEQLARIAGDVAPWKLR